MAQFNLHWDFTAWRPYDYQLGRFWGVDALADWAHDLTSYRFGFNNPILFNDPSGLWERTSNGWRTSDQAEINEFFQAWRNAGSNQQVLDAKQGNEEEELFRVVGDSRYVGVFYGEERKEDNAKFRIRSTPHSDDVNSKLEDVPMVGSYYQSQGEFEQGNYGKGVIYAGLGMTDVFSGGYGKIGMGLGITAVGLIRIPKAVGGFSKVGVASKGMLLSSYLFRSALKPLRLDMKLRYGLKTPFLARRLKKTGVYEWEWQQANNLSTLLGRYTYPIGLGVTGYGVYETLNEKDSE